MTHLTKAMILQDKRYSTEIDINLEPTTYLVKLAIETLGAAVRDNSLDELLAIGDEIEKGVYDA